MFLSPSHWRPRAERKKSHRAHAVCERQEPQDACLWESRCHVCVLACHSGTAGGCLQMLLQMLLLSMHGAEGRESTLLTDGAGINQSLELLQYEGKSPKQAGQVWCILIVIV